jgi:four helix bundle protein
MQHFTDLEAWTLARPIRIEIYTVAKVLSAEETLALASPRRRAAISITANIAEGLGRFHYPENIKFLEKPQAQSGN